MLRTERTVETDLQKTGLAALLVDVLSCPFHGVSTATHDNNNVSRFRIADIVKEVVLATGDLCNLVHVLLHHLGDSVVVGVDGLAALEVYVFVLRCNLEHWFLRSLCAFAEATYVLFIHQRSDLVVGNLLDLLQFVGSSETIKETQEGNLCFKGCKVSNQRHVHGFLYTGCTSHCVSGIAAGHYIGVIAKN